MTESANRFLAALTPGQNAKATFAFSDDERFNWHYISRDRKGLALREMTAYQKHLASALLASGLSQAGYIKAVTIMSLEEVLRALENDSGERRNLEKYSFTIFGTPADSWRDLRNDFGRRPPEGPLQNGRSPQQYVAVESDHFGGGMPPHSKRQRGAPTSLSVTVFRAALMSRTRDQ